MLLKITATGLGKKFGKDWIFRNLDFTLLPSSSYAIIGPNGSGKSTLLQLIAGNMIPTAGDVFYYESESKKISPEDYYRYQSIATPYLELIEEFTLKELLQFHFQFKKLRNNISIEQLAEIMMLKDALNKELRFFSSGMKQRVKLGIAFYSETPLLLLDEPTVNLDTNGIDWYRKQIEETKQNRILFICSNQKHEYDFCNEIIPVKTF